MILKTCNKCKATKNIDEFYKRTNGAPYSECKKCIIARSAEYERRNRGKVKESRRIRRHGNLKAHNEKTKEWRLENPEKHRRSVEAWKAANPAAWKEIQRKSQAKRRASPAIRASSAISRGIRKSIESGTKAGRKWESLVGYTVEELKTHLERKFQPGMTWDNYGEWHIDHKIPLAAHNYETPDDIDFKKAWALTNLQPLWALDNKKKHAKLQKGFQPSLALALPANDNKPKKDDAA